MGELFLLGLTHRGPETGFFLRNTWLHAVNSVKNPVSLAESVQDCQPSTLNPQLPLSPRKFRIET